MTWFLWQSDMLQLKRFLTECLHPLQVHSYHLSWIVKGRALLAAAEVYQSDGMPGFVNCLGIDSLGEKGGIEADTVAILPGLKLGSPFALKSSNDNAHMREPEKCLSSGSACELYDFRLLAVLCLLLNLSTCKSPWLLVSKQCYALWHVGL